ncbi:hypothetical protein [Haloferula sargassicola]
MRLLLVLLTSLILASCYHTAVAPLSSPGGQLVVVEIPGARPGRKNPDKVILDANEKLSSPFHARGWPLKYFSDFSLSDDGAEVAVLSPFGDMETKSGREFVGALPIIALRSTKSAESTENALRAVVADVYRNARKQGLRPIPVDDLKEQPEEAKP